MKKMIMLSAALVSVASAAERSSSQQKGYLQTCVSACSDTFYGTAFRYTSVTTEGPSSTADVDYLDSFFQGRGAIKQTINVKGKDISFYEETKSDTRHVTLLPFRYQSHINICSGFSFDSNDKTPH